MEKTPSREKIMTELIDESRAIYKHFDLLDSHINILNDNSDVLEKMDEENIIDALAVFTITKNYIDKVYNDIMDLNRTIDELISITTLEIEDRCEFYFTEEKTDIGEV